LLLRGRKAVILEEVLYFMNFQIFTKQLLLLSFFFSVFPVASLENQKLTKNSQSEALNLMVSEEYQKNKNVILSRESLNGLLALVGYGLRDDVLEDLETYWGKSLEKTAQSLQSLNKFKKGPVVISSVNALWADHDFQINRDYQASVSKSLGAEAKNLDFSQSVLVANEVNQWASQNTNKMITEIIKAKDITGDVVSVLANALYFKGEWELEFKKDNTYQGSFHLNSKEKKDVEMMRTVNAKYPFTVELSEEDKTRGVALLKLPYKGKKQNMIIAFPVKNTRNEWNANWEADLDYNVFDAYKKYISNNKATHKNTPYWNQKFTSLELPKFEVESSFTNIANQLKAIGLDSVFQKGVLSKMTSDSRAFLSKVIQKAKIKVDEKGTEAAAVTIGIARTTSVERLLDLKVNGPFAYAIEDVESKSILFEGIVANP